MATLQLDEIKKSYPDFLNQDEVEKILKIELSMLSHLADLRKIRGRIDSAIENCTDDEWNEKNGMIDSAEKSLRYIEILIKNLKHPLKYSNSPVLTI